MSMNVGSGSGMATRTSRSGGVAGPQAARKIRAKMCERMRAPMAIAPAPLRRQTHTDHRSPTFAVLGEGAALVGLSDTADQREAQPQAFTPGVRAFAEGLEERRLASFGQAGATVGDLEDDG